MKQQIYFFFLVLCLSNNAFANLNLNFKTACDSKNHESVLSFVGDILIHKVLYQSVVAGDKHFDSLWSQTKPLIDKADFSVANLEGPAAKGIDKNGKYRGDLGLVYDGDVYSGTNFVFNYHPDILTDLMDSGFDLVTTANNHATDRFSIGIDKTILAAREINFPTVGTRLSTEADGKYYAIADVKNIRVAFISCTEYINIPDTTNQVLFCETDEIFKTIKLVNAMADVDAVIVLPHWGIEYTHSPKDYQKEFARRYLEAGASAVIGAHPHVLQPWEKYITKNGRETLIIYSLGNFVAAQSGLEKQTGAIAYLGLSKNKNEKAKIYAAAYTPTYRVGTQIIPIGTLDNPEVIKHTNSMYGNLARVEPAESLKSVMCSIR